MGSTVSERVELAKLCSSRNWSKAIRILDSLLSQSCAIEDLCNRAFCYSQLELHKHVIKDCDKALQLDPKLLQAYILKGRALSALGRKEDALLIWEQGYECAIHQSADLKQLLELEELLACAKRNGTIVSEDHVMKSSSPTMLDSDSGCENNCNASDTSEIYRKSVYTSETESKSSDTCEIDGISSDAREIDGKSSDTSETRSKSSDTSETCSKSSNTSATRSKSSDASEERSESKDISEIRSKLGDESKRNHKFFTSGISKNKSISLDFRLSRGIAQVNEGKYAYAVSIFDQILKENPSYPEALIGRGTAYAFQRELDAAIADFTKAIECNPSTGEAWKRRGQARAALGEPAEAIEDLTKALEFEPNSSDILHERGIVNFKFKDYNAAVEDLSSCVKLDKDNKSAFTYLGLALASIGEYRKAEEAHKKSIQLDQNFLEGWAHLAQFYQDLANPVKALECLQQGLQIDARFAKAYHLRGLLRHGMGEHRNAIKDLSVELSIENSNIECLYLRASCYHAIGEYGNAVKDYDAVLDLELDSMEKFVLQCLAFYQKEIALYTASKINMEFCCFDIDGDINPLFKEYWCKRLHPKYVCEKVFRQPPLRESLKKGRLRKQDFVVTKQKATLLQAADSLGKKIQYDCPGFLPNRRQHRMAGLAAIEIAQKVSKAWRSLQAEWKHSSKRAAKIGKTVRKKEKAYVLSQNRGGVGCSTSSTSETSTSCGSNDDRGLSRSMMSWQDIYSLAVKWRQISEPCDPVVWVNKLSEEFNTGFGSHTPMVLGQAKVVRYFPNYQRTMSVAKTVAKETMYVNNKTDDVIDLSKDGRLEKIMQAESCSDLYDVIGEDFWLATSCESTAFEGKRLEGTRITLQKMNEQGFDFAIRTPCTPSRWDDYDAEMAMAWEAICSAYCGETYGSTDFNMLEKLRDAILRMTYYWYNFMPLSRGSAVVGFVVLLGLFLAANMEVTESIPQGLQVDWEAILTSGPNLYVDSIKRWLYPSLKIKTSWKEYPDVQSAFTTTGSVIAALSSYDD
ncbi:suppressor of RPS4-RLD 1 isoform X2 [Telopea speciosissima]|uniref:suppressor of RPS4-RLD 1 isoform X2 n=1 Tax=Telopea speciosissima TaxID=54955 RepID=UPI001CC59AD0|nr:suppressor of RPS4-RLD 1 isoform X2 [Telopea speciosissima]